MNTGPTRFTVSVRITHQATADDPLPLPKPYCVSIDRDTREEAEALVEEFWRAAAESGMGRYLVTEIAPIRAPSPVAGEILPGGGAIIGETLNDVLDPNNWTETRFVTTRKP